MATSGYVLKCPLPVPKCLSSVPTYLHESPESPCVSLWVLHVSLPCLQVFLSLLTGLLNVPACPQESSTCPQSVPKCPLMLLWNCQVSLSPIHVPPGLLSHLGLHPGVSPPCPQVHQVSPSVLVSPECPYGSSKCPHLSLIVPTHPSSVPMGLLSVPSCPHVLPHVLHVSPSVLTGLLSVPPCPHGSSECPHLTPSVPKCPHASLSVPNCPLIPTPFPSPCPQPLRGHLGLRPLVSPGVPTCPHVSLGAGGGRGHRLRAAEELCNGGTGLWP